MFRLLALSALLLTLPDGQAQILKVPESCTGFNCENNGKLSTVRDECTCTCPDSYTGLQCETEVKDSTWPDGPYALPMPIYGCPESGGRGWKTGYLNMTFTEKIRNSASVTQAKTLSLLGPYGDRVIQMNFCYKTSGSSRTPVSWPLGSYSVYRAGGACPPEFEEQELRLELPELHHATTDGFLPDLVVLPHNSSTAVTITVCDKPALANDTVTKRQWTYPFILLEGTRKQNTSMECPSFYRMDVSIETIDLLSTNLARYRTNSTDKISVKAFRYCVVKESIKRPEERVEVDVDTMWFLPTYVVAIMRFRASSAYEEIYRTYPITKYGQPRRNFFVNPHYFETAKIPLDVFLESRETPWLLIDLLQTIQVDQIELDVIGFNDIHWTWTHGVSPAIGISLKRWAFLNRGAMSCDRNLKRDDGFSLLRQLCSRPITGRYVSIYGKGYDLSPAMTATFFVGLEEVLVHGKGRGCGKDLGLRDFGIEDFQISASSSKQHHPPSQARPNLQGWCAAHHDSTPYLQVDLLVATTVEGIRVYNFATTLDVYTRNVYSLRTFYSGVRSFWFEYGFNEAALQPYTSSNGRKVFWLDLSLPYHHEQAFFLQTPVVASLLRIRPTGFQVLDSVSTCMKLELIGCRKSKLKTVKCSNRNATFWTRRSEILISSNSYNAALSMNSTNHTSCIELCNGCGAIKFHNDDMSCAVYNTSETANFRRVKETAKTITYQKTCLHDPVVLPPWMIKITLGSIKEDIFPTELQTSVDDEVSIASQGFPLPYDTGVITKWNIDLAAVCGLKANCDWNVVTIIFTNIALNIYQSSEDWFTDEQSEDGIDLVRGDTRLSKHGAGLTRENIITTLNNTMNNRQVVYSTMAPVLEVRFRAYLRESTAIFRGNGFRAIITTLGKPSADSYTEATHCDASYKSTFGEVLIASRSFKGLQDDTNRIKEYFLVCGQYGLGTVRLTIAYLEVRCVDFASLEIIDYAVVYKHCNLNRPMTTIISRTEILGIQLYYDKVYDIRGVQGFKGRYEQVAQTKVVQTKPYKFSASIGGRGFGSVSECVARLGRCFRVYSNTYPTLFEKKTLAFLTADGANAKCAELMGPDARLVTVRSRFEARYISTHLLLDAYTRHHESQLDKSVKLMNTIYDYLYIGLVWYTNSQGTLKAQWRDGSPVVYSAWSAKQPSGLNASHTTKPCTRARIYSMVEPEAWESIECDRLAAEHIICETDMRTTESNIENLHQQLPETTQTTRPVESYRSLQCGSGDLVSQLYVCDGIRDCLDGTDELSCETQGNSPGTCKRSDEFECSNGECISIGMTCDFTPDCSDGSDENCVSPDCTSNQFQCTNRQCVPVESVCNFIKDCLDGSDEADCHETCRAGTFKCSDRSCIPSGRQCDGFDDCSDLSDERYCGTPSRSSCLDWWEHGHRQTGVFIVSNTKVLCNFDLVASEGIVQTKYYNIQAEKNKYGQFELVYENLGFVSEMMKRLDCNQSLLHTCEPPEDFINELEWQFGSRRPNECTCRRLMWTQNASYAEWCSANAVDGQLNLDKVGVLTNHRERPLMNVEPVTPSFDNLWMKVEPIVCNERVEFRGDKLLCAKGNIISTDRRCLYDVDAYGDVIGCRDLTHLQNCETFTCPYGFVKCDDSFCIASSLLCDGEKQCPNGQDEVNCWCGYQDRFTVILYENNARMDEPALNLARKLYDYTKTSASSNVGLARYQVATLGLQQGMRTRGHIELEYTTYLPRKTAQFSKKRSLFLPSAAAIIPYTLTVTETHPSAIIVLQNSAIGSQLPITELMAFDHALIDDIELDAVYFGWEPEFCNSEFRKRFPLHTKFLHFKDDTKVVPLSFGPTVCPELPKELLPRCLGMYRCHASRQCLSFKNVCDGFRQCRFGDDEKLCDFDCPARCVCRGFETDCSLNRTSKNTFTSLSRNTKYLDLHSNDFKTFQFSISRLPFLISLNLSSCLLPALPALFLKSMQNLRTLDVSFNSIRHLKRDDLSKKFHLTHLFLTGNYELAVIEPESFRDLTSLKQLTVTGSKIGRITTRTFKNLNLTLLDLSGNRLVTIDDKAFDGATIKNLNIRGNQLTDIQRGVFRGLADLKSLSTDSYKLCCMRPDTVEDNACNPFHDEFTSCSDLIREDTLRDFLWIMGSLSTLGNSLSLLYRLKFDRERLSLSYVIFVTNLAVADLLMGLYLLIVVAVDLTFRGNYADIDHWWKSSALCGLAGVLATVSSQASILFICLIALDRVSVIKYPFGEFRLSTRQALVAAAAAWLIAVNITLIPVWFSFNSSSNSNSVVCLALPLTRGRPPGWPYPTAGCVVFTFLALSLTGVGQLLLHKDGRSTWDEMKMTTTHRSRDLRVSRNLLRLATMDLLCWLAVALMGLRALLGEVVSSDSYGMAGLILLTLTSAVNPLLYTLPAIVWSKEFVPSPEEKYKSAVYGKGTVIGILNLWDNGHLYQKLSTRRGYIPLLQHLAGHALTPAELLRVVLRVFQTIERLHAVDMVLGNFGLELISIRASEGVVSDAVVRVSPRLATRKNEQSEDMVNVGEIFSDLLLS